MYIETLCGKYCHRYLQKVKNETVSIVEDDKPSTKFKVIKH